MIQNKELRPYDLNIKEIDNRFVVTIDKKQLNPEYILNLMNWLQFETKQSKEQKNSDEIVQMQKKERIWNYSGSVSFDNQLDNVNIRDLAYD